MRSVASYVDRMVEEVPVTKILVLILVVVETRANSFARIMPNGAQSLSPAKLGVNRATGASLLRSVGTYTRLSGHSLCLPVALMLFTSTLLALSPKPRVRGTSSP